MLKNGWKCVNGLLSKCVENALIDTGFENATPVQAETIPKFLSNKDVSVEACTGSGKTLSFIIPLVELLVRGGFDIIDENLSHKNFVGAIVISPTRELARQIFKVTQNFCTKIEGLKQSILLLTGGSDFQKDIENIEKKGCKIVIATPGRLSKIFRSCRNFNVSKLEVFVLDEADRILQMGFKTQLDTILSRLPKQRRTGLFSATQSKDIEELIRAGLRNPVQINISIKSHANGDNINPGNFIAPKNKDFKEEQLHQIPSKLENFQFSVEANQKFGTLIRFLQLHQEKKILVFMLTCACVDYFSKLLYLLAPKIFEKKFELFSIHGKMFQKQRSKIYKKFEAVSECGAVLLCTDLIARGIDFPDIDWIVQYDAPQDSSFFVHRIGRTARMGKTGQAILLLMPNENKYVSVLKDQIGVQIDEYKNKDLNYLSDFSKDLTNKIHFLAKGDRDIMEKGQRAFVSFIRGYKEHQCIFAFNINQLAIGNLATGFGLLYFPKMNDFIDVVRKGKNKEKNSNPILQQSNQSIEGFDSPNLTQQEINNIEYSDKKREILRKTKLAETEQKKKQQYINRLIKRKQIQSAKLKYKKERRKRKKSKNFDKMLEQNELAEETRLLKRLKRGKITKTDYEKQIIERY